MDVNYKKIVLELVLCTIMLHLYSLWLYANRFNIEEMYIFACEMVV